MKRGVLCRRGHDAWRKVHLDRPSGGSWICVTCRRASAMRWYDGLEGDRREDYLKRQRLSRKKKLIAVAAEGVKRS